MTKCILLAWCLLSLVQGWAQAPAIWPTKCEFTDGAGNPIVPAAGRPFVLNVFFSYNNPTTNSYRLRWDYAGVTNYSWSLNWGAGAPRGNYGYVLAAWTRLDAAGTNPFTVKVDCDDAIVGAALAPKTLSFPLRVMTPLNQFDFSGWDAFFRSRIPDDGSGGYAWAGLENGQVVAQGAGGYARAPWEPVDPGVRLSVDHPMNLASVSKLITRVGLARLWELKRGTAGAFEYTNRVAPYLSGLVTNLHPSFGEVTIQHLYDHTSGLTNDFNDLASLQSVLTQPLAWPPGSQFQYLNGNYYLLATVMSVIAGQSYHDFMAHQVFEPLGMTHTEDHATEPSPVLAYGPASLRWPGVLMQVSGTQNAGAGGWWSNVGDLARLLRSLRYSTLLEPATSARFGFNQGVWAADGGFTWVWNGTYGQLSTRVYRYNESLDGILLINSGKGPAGSLLDEAFRLPQPGLRLELQRQGNQLACSFLGHAGFSYSLQRAAAPASSSWTNYVTVAGSNLVHTVNIPMTQAREFFRLKRN